MPQNLHESSGYALSSRYQDKLTTFAFRPVFFLPLRLWDISHIFLYIMSSCFVYFVLPTSIAFNIQLIALSLDRNPNCSSCQEAFSKIAIAYETLSDESKRGAYDEAGGVAASELKSAKSVPLTRDNFHELVTFSNDVWIVQVFRPDNPHCASFHPFWENQIQKYGHLVRFGRIDLTDDQAKWLPLKVRVLPTVLKFAKHLGNVEIFPITQMHETPQALMKFVLTSFPNIGLPLNVDKGALTSWLSKSTRRHKVLFAIPGKSEEERYKSHLICRKLAARWSEIFEMRSAEMAILHQLQGLQEVKAALPAESQKAAVLFFPAAGVTVPKASAAFDWPSGEEEIVLELLRFTEKVGVPLSVQNAELMCRSLVIRRVYCLVLVDASDFAMARAAQDLGASRSQYQGEVAEIRAGGGEVSEDEDNFVVPILRLLRNPQRWFQSPSIASCYAPKFPEVEKALGASSAFLMDLDTSRIVPLRLSSFRGLYPQIAYEDSLTWVEGWDPIRSLPDCSEGLRQRFMRNLVNASISEVLWQLLCALFLVEAAAKALTSQSWRWWLGVLGMSLALLMRSPPFWRHLDAYIPEFLRAGQLIAPWNCLGDEEKRATSQSQQIWGEGEITRGRHVFGPFRLFRVGIFFPFAWTPIIHQCHGNLIGLLPQTWIKYKHLSFGNETIEVF